jgi:hypothetical protein
MIVAIAVPIGTTTGATTATIAATNGMSATETEETMTGMVTGTVGRPALERKGPIKMQALDPTAWRSRCAQRMAELDPDLTRSEAERLARDVHAFERTRAMEPEAAAEFVSIEMSRPERAPFERRSAPRGREAGAA